MHCGFRSDTSVLVALLRPVARFLTSALPAALLRRLQMIDRQTEQHAVLPPPRNGSMDRMGTVGGGAQCVLSRHTQCAFYELLHGPLTALQHQTALRRHAAVSRCTLSDVLRVSDLGWRVFLMVAMRWRGPFARVCHEWADIARLCWQADEFDLVRVLQHVQLQNIGGPVTQLTSWVRSHSDLIKKPVFFMLALTEEGRLEQMRVSCKRAEPGMPSTRPDDDVRVEHCKNWSLEEAVPSERHAERLDTLEGAPAQFVVTKHHAYCVVAVRGQALLVKLGGQTNGTHEHMYTDRFPSCVTTMAMCPLDNNIIAFGVPLSGTEAASAAGGGAAARGSGVALDEPADAMVGDPWSQPWRAGGSAKSGCEGRSGGDGIFVGGGGPSLARCKHVIELVNFAQSSRIQTLHTHHEKAMLLIDYSPDAEQLLSCSADCVQLWYQQRDCKASLESRGHAEGRLPGSMDETPERTLRFPPGTTLCIAKLHPAWTSVLLATNEALEVRELRRRDGECHAPLAGGAPASSSNDISRSGAPFSLKWRRQNIQVTAATFVSHGNMLIVSDRGDRLLILNYHGLQAAKRCVLPWAIPQRSLEVPPPVLMDAAAGPSRLAGGGAAAGTAVARNDAGADGLDPLQAGAVGLHFGGLGYCGGSSSSSCRCSDHEPRGRVVRTVTSIVECPDVTTAEEWRSGVSLLAVSSSRGDIILIKI